MSKIKSPDNSLDNYIKNAEKSFQKTQNPEKDKLSRDFSLNPFSGIDMSPTEKAIQDKKNEISFLISKNPNNKYYSDEVEKLTNQVLYLAEDETIYELWANKLIKNESLKCAKKISQLLESKKTLTADEFRYESDKIKALKYNITNEGKNKIYKKIKKSSKDKPEEDIINEVSKEQNMFFENRHKYFMLLEKSKNNSQEITEEEIKTRDQLKSWLEWNLTNKDYVSFEEFSSTMSYLKRQTKDAINKTQEFINKYSEYLKFW